MRFARVGEPNIGYRGVATPGPPFDRQTRRSRQDIEQRGAADVGGSRANSVFRTGPCSACEQPRARRDLSEPLTVGLRRGRKVDQSLLDAEWSFSCPMTARQI